MKLAIVCHTQRVIIPMCASNVDGIQANSCRQDVSSSLEYRYGTADKAGLLYTKLFCMQTCTGKSGQRDIQCNSQEVSSGRINPQLQVTAKPCRWHFRVVNPRCVQPTLAYRGHSSRSMKSPNLGKEEENGQSGTRQSHCKRCTSDKTVKYR